MRRRQAGQVAGAKSEPETLASGSLVTVVKLNPDGQEVARYAADVLDEACPAPWFALRAHWTMKRVEVGGLVFEPGDTIIEYFSVSDWYNAFWIIAPDSHVRGVYGNVTFPTTISVAGGETVVTWQDLYLDVLRLDDGSVHLCDEDELAASGLATTDPELTERIQAVASQMMNLARAGTFPFHTPLGK